MPTIAETIAASGLDRREAALLLAHVLKHDDVWVRASERDAIDPADARRFEALVARRRKGEPVAYLVGSQPFCGAEFLVNRHTLIPRPETEQLAEMALDAIRHDVRPIILDIGTGSGCIAATIARIRPDATVIASDISKPALAIARKNAKRLGAKVTFVKDDLIGKRLLAALSKVESLRSKATKGTASGKPDFRLSTLDFRLTVIANLPYIPTGDKKTMMRDVVNYEPSSALFAGKDGLALIRKLFSQLKRIVQRPESGVRDLRLSTCDFRLFLEIDPSQPAALNALVKKTLPPAKTRIEKDLCGRERFFVVEM